MLKSRKESENQTVQVPRRCCTEQNLESHGKTGTSVTQRRRFYEKPEASMYNFEHACSIKKFLSVLANNDQLKDIIITNFNKLQYSHTKEPEAKYFQEILENSLSPTGVTYF